MKNNTYELMRIQRQNSIIEAAYKLFLSKGIGHATMKDIADEARISRQTLYSYYNHIDELIIAVQGEIAKNVMPRTSSLSCDYNSSPIEYLREYIISILQLGINCPKEMIFMSQFDLYFKLYPASGKLFEDLNHVYIDSETRKIIINQIIKGQNEGSIRKDKTSYEIYSTVINLSLGLVQRILLIGNRMDITSEIEPKTICSNFIDMIIEFIEEKN